MANKKTIYTICSLLFTVCVQIATLVLFIWGLIENKWFWCNFGFGHEDVRINIMSVCEGDKCESHAEKTRKNF